MEFKFKAGLESGAFFGKADIGSLNLSGQCCNLVKSLSSRMPYYNKRSPKCLHIKGYGYNTNQSLKTHIQTIVMEAPGGLFSNLRSSINPLLRVT